MMKYQIFVSSTFEDLKPERDQVIKAILEMGHIPVGMEMFSAADQQQWEVIKKQIDQSDYYVVLVAHRYGSMDSGVSYTEKEYDYAVQQKLPALGFILESSVDWPQKWIENNYDIKKRLDLFKSKVSSRMVSFWKTPEDLYGRAGIALMKAFSSQPREGWVRASQAKTSEMTSEIMRLSRENGLLRSELETTARRTTKGEEAKIDQIIDALRKNKRKIYAWKDSAKGWGDPMDTDLLVLFETIAPELLDEASNSALGGCLGLRFRAERTYGPPVPTNFVTSYIADFVSLDLLSTSGKRHSVSDTAAYWTLTEFGRVVHASIRRNELLKGLIEPEETPEDSTASSNGNQTGST